MVRRTNRELRSLILASFKDNPMPIREIALKTNIDWYSTERHLSHLKGRDLVTEVFTHKLLRLFQITDLGKEVVKELKVPSNKELLKIIKRSI